MKAITRNNLFYGKDSDASLIRRAKNGDCQAFDELVRRFQKPLYYGIIRITLNHEDTDDIVQETFIKAYHNLDSYNENHSFYAWIYRMAVNAALNCVKRKKLKEDSLDRRQEESHFDPSEVVDPLQEYNCNEIHEQIRNALNDLTPEMRTVFVMRVYEEMSYKEISQILDISVGTVMSRLNRARAFLKKCLQKEGWLENNI